MNMRESVWELLHDQFETDDGSLPDIYINNVSSEGVVRIWNALREHSSGLGGEPTLWHNGEERDVDVNSVENAADLVISGETHQFHVVLRGVTFEGTSIPDLGVFVFPDGVDLDYQMGPEWSPSSVEALLRLLTMLSGLAPDCEVVLPQEYPPEFRNRFSKALSMFMGDTA
jgi:hypothetical protein